MKVTAGCLNNAKTITHFHVFIEHNMKTDQSGGKHVHVNLDWITGWPINFQQTFPVIVKWWGGLYLADDVVFWILLVEAQYSGKEFGKLFFQFIMWHQVTHWPKSLCNSQTQLQNDTHKNNFNTFTLERMNTNIEIDNNRNRKKERKKDRKI